MQAQLEETQIRAAKDFFSIFLEGLDDKIIHHQPDCEVECNGVNKTILCSVDGDTVALVFDDYDVSFVIPNVDLDKRYEDIKERFIVPAAEGMVRAINADTQKNLLFAPIANDLIPGSSEFSASVHGASLKITQSYKAYEGMCWKFQMSVSSFDRG